MEPRSTFRSRSHRRQWRGPGGGCSPQPRIGVMSRSHTCAGPSSSIGRPVTRRTSMASENDCPRGRPLSWLHRSQSSGSGSGAAVGVGSDSSSMPLSATPMRNPRATRTSVSFSSLRTASRTCMRRPIRRGSMLMCSGATGTGRSSSTLSRVSRHSASSFCQRSSIRPTRAAGGPPCIAWELHGPVPIGPGMNVVPLVSNTPVVGSAVTAS